MSKIGRRPIEIGNVTVEINGQEVSYKGPLASGTHVLPALLKAELNDKLLTILPTEKTSDTNRLWGLHRALLANKIIGADKGFTRQLRITGLGYKAVKKGKGLEFSLGYSHKINFDVPEEVTIEVDRPGQLLTCKSFDKELLGNVCSKIRSLRPPEPYKGTGIQYTDEVIIRKAGKAKA